MEWSLRCLILDMMMTSSNYKRVLIHCLFLTWNHQFVIVAVQHTRRRRMSTSTVCSAPSPIVLTVGLRLGNSQKVIQKNEATYVPYVIVSSSFMKSLRIRTNRSRLKQDIFLSREVWMISLIHLGQNYSRSRKLATAKSKSLPMTTRRCSLWWKGMNEDWWSLRKVLRILTRETKIFRREMRRRRKMQREWTKSLSGTRRRCTESMKSCFSSMTSISDSLRSRWR